MNLNDWSHEVPIRSFAIHIGDKNNKHPCEVSYADIRVSFRGIESYVLNELAPKSLYKELLLSHLTNDNNNNNNNNNKTWRLSWLVSSNQIYDIPTDTRLHEIVLTRQNFVCNLKIHFERKAFEEWRRKQFDKKSIPKANILEIKQDGNNGNVKIYVDYPKNEPIYQLRYRYYENDLTSSQDEMESRILGNRYNTYGDNNDNSNNNDNNTNNSESKPNFTLVKTSNVNKDIRDHSGHNNNGHGIKWRSCNKEFITLSNLWMFKRYTIEVRVENKFSKKLGEVLRNCNIERIGHQKIAFNSLMSTDDLNMNNENESSSSDEDDDDDDDNDEMNENREKENRKIRNNRKNNKNKRNKKDKNRRKERGGATAAALGAPKTDVLEDFEKFDHSRFYNWCKKIINREWNV